MTFVTRDGKDVRDRWMSLKHAAVIRPNNGVTFQVPFIQWQKC